MLYIHNATLCAPAALIPDAALLVEGERIAALGPAAQIPSPPGAEIVDAGGMLLAPGFIDLQCNGAFGHDFTADPGSVWEVGARLPQHGVTAFLPTLVSSPLTVVARAQAVLHLGPPPGYAGASALGLHVEGPFLNPARRGAHNAAYLRPPDLAAVAGWSPQAGVRLVTLAPELPDALDLVRSLRERGVVVGAGHSLATWDEAQAGLAAGVTYGTHLFNAMPPLGHRAPGLAAALLADERAVVGLIADGLHLHPAVVTLAWRAAAGRVNLVTDCIAALGMPPGEYQLGDFEVRVDDTGARLADGRLAGSVLRLDQAVRNLLAFTGCSATEALSAVTEVPARLLGLAHERGRLAPGLRADLVLLSEDLQVQAAMVGGRLIPKV